MAHGGLSHFKATLARKKERDDKRRGKNDSSTYKISDTKPEYNFPKLSEEELEKVKTEIRQKLNKEKRREYIILSFVLIVIVATILYFIS